MQDLALRGADRPRFAALPQAQPAAAGDNGIGDLAAAESSGVPVRPAGATIACNPPGKGTGCGHGGLAASVPRGEQGRRLSPHAGPRRPPCGRTPNSGGFPGTCPSGHAAGLVQIIPFGTSSPTCLSITTSVQADTCALPLTSASYKL